MMNTKFDEFNVKLEILLNRKSSKLSATTQIISVKKKYEPNRKINQTGFREMAIFLVKTRSGGHTPVMYICQQNDSSAVWQIYGQKIYLSLGDFTRCGNLETIYQDSNNGYIYEWNPLLYGSNYSSNDINSSYFVVTIPLIMGNYSLWFLVNLGLGNPVCWSI